MKVLSLFDGISCGRLALERAAIPVEKYYASEIDPYAIRIAKKNFPDTVQLGDVCGLTSPPQVDLLIGGSPCQGFSIAGKRLNFEDYRSRLFFEFVRVLKAVKPKYFLLENVKMKREWQDIISGYMGVEPIEINSSIFSAQNRKRVYWTNLPVKIPADKGILLKDIVHEYADGMKQDELAEYIVPIDKTLKILNAGQGRKIGFFRKDCQANRVYSIHGKAVTLCGEAGGGGGAAKMGQYLFTDTKRNGQGDRVYTETEKSPCLNASSGGTAGRGNCLFGRSIECGEVYIRKLTPVECERLQTLPDNYTEGIPAAQRYKCLGNGWTVDVITHIFGGIK